MNRFGHDRLAPRLDLDPARRPIPDRLPPAIYKFMDVVEDVYRKPKRFPELQFPELSRQRRSERREAIVLVLKAEALRMDLPSQRVVGRRLESGFVEGIAVKQLAAWTGLDHGRVERALADLTRAGYQTSKQPREAVLDPLTGETKYTGLPAVRRFDSLFFRRLGGGFALMMKLAQDEASARRRKEREKENRAQAEAAVAAAAAAVRSSQPRLGRDAVHPQLPVPPVRASSPDEGFQRLYQTIALGLRQKHPDWPLERVRAEARKLAAGPPE